MDYLKKHPMIWFWLSLVFAAQEFLVTEGKAPFLDFLGLFSPHYQKSAILIFVFISFSFSIISIIRNKTLLVKVLSGLLTAYYLLALMVGLSNVD